MYRKSLNAFSQHSTVLCRKVPVLCTLYRHCTQCLYSVHTKENVTIKRMKQANTHNRYKKMFEALYLSRQTFE